MLENVFPLEREREEEEKKKKRGTRDVSVFLLVRSFSLVILSEGRGITERHGKLRARNYGAPVTRTRQMSGKQDRDGYNLERARSTAAQFDTGMYSIQLRFSSRTFINLFDPVLSS